MSFYIVVTALTFGLVIVFIENRRKADGFIDFYRGISIFYFLLFVAVPIWMQIAGEWVFYRRHWEWALKQPFDDSSFLLAIILALFSYLICYASYLIFTKTKQFKFRNNISFNIYNVSNKFLLGLCIFLFFFAGISFVINVWNYGGLTRYLTFGMIVRAGNVDIGQIVANTSLEFFKKFARISMANTFLLIALKDRYKQHRFLVNTLLVSSFFMALMVLFNGGGRLSFISFFAAIGFYKILIANKFDLKKIFLIGFLFVLLSLIGKQFFAYFLNPGSLSNRITLFLQDVVLIPNFILIEFSFPIVSLANAVREVGQNISYKYFLDYIIALYELLPAQLFGLPLNKFLSASVVNSLSFGRESGVPVDTVTFGYMSLGTIGVALVSALLGSIAAFFERLLPYVNSPLILMLRANWIMLVAFTVMYGGPTLILFRNFYFIIPTILLFSPSFIKIFTKK